MAMRMGPFSNPAVIAYINQHFAPIFVSNEDYREGKLGQEEKERLEEIRRTARAKGLSGGAVQVYLLKPNADVIDVMHVAKASQLKQLMPWLRGVTETFGTVSGKTLVPPSTTLQRPSTSAEAMAFHFRGQFLNRETSYVDDWVLLKQEEWSQFVRDPQNTQSTEWQIEPELAKKILLRFYPYAADWSPDIDLVKAAELRIRVLPGTPDKRLLAVEGSMVRVQNRHLGHTPNRLDLEVIGLVKIMADHRPQITLTTYRAVFGQEPFEGLLQSVVADQERNDTSQPSPR